MFKPKYETQNPYWKTLMYRYCLAQIVMWIVTIASVVGFIRGLHFMTLASDDRVWIETWRTISFVVIAGLSTILVYRPRSSPGVWELLFGQRMLMVLMGVKLGDRIPEVPIAARVDLLIVIAVASAWFLSCGWRSWSQPIGITKTGLAQSQKR